MTVLNELDTTLHAMSVVHIALMFTFLTSYPLALGEMFLMLQAPAPALCAPEALPSRSLPR